VIEIDRSHRRGINSHLLSSTFLYMRYLTFIFLLTSSVAVSAATVRGTITSGAADLTLAGQEANESFAVNGTGFSFTGTGVVSEPPCSPFSVCTPGNPIDAAFAALSSEDSGVGGLLTIQDRSHSYSEDPGAPGGAGINYNFNLSTPAANPPATLTLTGPFTATANFADPDVESGNLFEFDGRGSVTIRLTFVPAGELGPAQYLLQNAHFTFANAPEPSTGLMAVGSLSLIAIVGTIKKRRAQGLRHEQERGSDRMH
jgi:hypothetical protein